MLLTSKILLILLEAVVRLVKLLLVPVQVGDDRLRANTIQLFAGAHTVTIRFVYRTFMRERWRVISAETPVEESGLEQQQRNAGIMVAIANEWRDPDRVFAPRVTVLENEDETFALDVEQKGLTSTDEMADRVGQALFPGSTPELTPFWDRVKESCSCRITFRMPTDRGPGGPPWTVRPADSTQSVNLRDFLAGDPTVEEGTATGEILFRPLTK